MNEITSEPKKINKLLMAFWHGYYLEKNTISLVVGSKGYADSLINRMQEKKILTKKTVKGRAYYKLTEWQGEHELQTRLAIASKNGPLIREGRINNAQYITRYAKRSRALVTFNCLGMETFSYASPSLDVIDSNLSELVMYIDCKILKDALGEETQGARLTGLVVNKDSIYRLYAENSIFFCDNGTEDRIVNRFKAQTHIDKNVIVNDIVLVEKFTYLDKFFKNLFGLGNNIGTPYNIKGSRDKYLFDMENIHIQSDLMINNKLNKLNENLGKILTIKLKRELEQESDKQDNDTNNNSLQVKVSHKELKAYKGGYILNAIIPNMGLIKEIYDTCKRLNNKRQKDNNNIFNVKQEEAKYTLVCMKEQEKVYKDLFNGAVELYTITNEDIKNLLED